MLMFLAAIYAIIMNSWNEFWNEYDPEEHKMEI